jgi:hypothetical protein
LVKNVRTIITHITMSIVVGIGLIRICSFAKNGRKTTKV